MFATILKPALAAVMGLTLAAPPPPIPVQLDTDKPGDGVVSPAACRPLGFLLPDPGGQLGVGSNRFSGTPAGPGYAPAPPPYVAPPPPPPSPPPRPIPGPPPPPAPPAPMRPSVVGAVGSMSEVVVSGSRIVQTRGAAADTERYPDATPNPVHRVSDEPVSTFSIDVDTASYANVRRFIAEGTTPPQDAVRVEEMVNAFDYDYARPTGARSPFAISTAVVASPWSPSEHGGRQIIHIGLQGYELPAGERKPLNLTFMVDVSGSMQSPDKLVLAQKAMNLIIDRLRPEDRVAVTYYASDVGTAVGPTSGDQKLKLRCAVATLNAGGSTAGAQGMVNAYQQAQAAFGADKVNRILMFTDGDFNVGVTDDKRIEDYVAEKRGTGIYLSVYGFGRGNYQDARMQTIAQAGNGIAAYVDDLNEARRLFGPAFDKGAFPIADDVKIQVEFNPGRVAEYRLIGYETRLLNEADFSNDRVDAGEVGSGASVTALYEITPVGGPSQVPERRYDANRPGSGPDNSLGVGGGDRNGEVGFVQVRYKLPGETQSHLIQKVISNGVPGQITARPAESTRWALAVAAFGQKLRGDPWLSPDYGWGDILDQAQGSRGPDPYGERAAFVQMVRAAGTLPPRAAP